jgi:hypothetical protein
LKGVDEILGVEQMVLNHVLGSLRLVEDGGQIGVRGHFEHVLSVDVEVILPYFFANQAPRLLSGYIPEEIALFLLLKGDGQFLMQLLFAVPPRDHCALLPFEVVVDAHAGTEKDALTLFENLNVVDTFILKLISKDK